MTQGTFRRPVVKAALWLSLSATPLDPPLTGEAGAPCGRRALRGRRSLAATPIEAATVEVATAADDAGPKISPGLGRRLEGRWVQRP